MYYSQDQQDEILETFLFKGLRDGFFVDVGAHDGITFNNTFFFEKERGWKGINIEPIPKVFQTLEENRPNCTNLNLAIAEKEGEATFVLNQGGTEMLSGLQEHMDPRHLLRIHYENETYGGSTQVIKVKTRRLASLFEELGISHIHYLSIDVEGAEAMVLHSIDFDKVFIDVIGFENNYHDVGSVIVEELVHLGYEMIHWSLDVLMVHKHSPFFPLETKNETPA